FAILFTPEDHAEHVPERELEKAKIKGRSGDYRWHRRKDGSLFWVFGSVNSLKDESGNLIRYVKVACDATWREEAEESLRESEADFRAIFELAGTGIAQADLRTGRLLRVNRKFCEITGYSSEELLSKTIQELTDPEDRERDFAVYQRMLRGEGE